MELIKRSKMPTKIYSWKCPKCNKVIESLHKEQFKFNKKMHRSTCKGEKR
jgi:glutaredoxin-related protein